MSDSPSNAFAGFEEGSILVCQRGYRWIGGYLSGGVLKHCRLPCGFVGPLHCEKVRYATDFEQALIEEANQQGPLAYQWP